MPHAKLSLARFVVVVTGPTLLLGLLIPAMQVGFGGSTGYHVHRSGEYHRTPFWPRYCGRLSGTPWRETYRCSEGEDAVIQPVDLPRPSGNGGRDRGSSGSAR